MGFMSKVRSIDLFGPRVSLRLSNKKEYKTAFGGMFTIILFMGTIFVAFIYLVEMTSHTNPSLQLKESLWPSNESYSVNRFLVTHAFAVYDTSNDAYVTDISLEVTVKSSGTTNTLPMQACTKGTSVLADQLDVQIEATWGDNGDNADSTSTNSADAANNTSLTSGKFAGETSANSSISSSFFCLSEENFEVVSSIKMDYMSTVQVRIAGVSWNESNDESIPASSYEIRYLQLDHYFDATNFENPFQEYWRTLAVEVDGLYLATQIRLQMALKTVVTIAGYLESDTSYESQIYIENMNVVQNNVYVSKATTTTTTSPPPQHEILIMFSFDRKIGIHTRSYLRILGVLAIIGGFMKSQMVCYRFITRPFTKTALYTSLLNELFCFEEDESDSDDGQYNHKNKAHDSGKLSSPNHRKGRLHLASTKEEQDREQEENTKLTRLLNQHIYNEGHGINPASDKERVEAETVFMRFMRIGQTTLRMTQFDYIRNLFGRFCKNRKSKLIKISKKRVNERLDIVYILKKLVEVDKLKMILLTDEQRRVFDYLPKPLVEFQQCSNQHGGVNGGSFAGLNGKSNQLSMSSFRKRQSTLHGKQTLRTEWSLLNSEGSTLHKAILAVHSFQTIMRTDTAPLSIIDLKLIEMLDPKIIRKFSAIQLDALPEEFEASDAADDPAVPAECQRDIESSFEIQVVTSNLPPPPAQPVSQSAEEIIQQIDDDQNHFQPQQQTHTNQHHTQTMMQTVEGLTDEQNKKKNELHREIHKDFLAESQRKCSIDKSFKNDRMIFEYPSNDVIKNSVHPGNNNQNNSKQQQRNCNPQEKSSSVMVDMQGGAGAYKAAQNRINGNSYLQQQGNVKGGKKFGGNLEQLYLEQSMYSGRGGAAAAGATSMMRSNGPSQLEFRGFNVNKMQLVSQYLLYKDVPQYHGSYIEVDPLRTSSKRDLVANLHFNPKKNAEAGGGELAQNNNTNFQFNRGITKYFQDTNLSKKNASETLIASPILEEKTKAVPSSYNEQSFSDRNEGGGGTHSIERNLRDLMPPPSIDASECSHRNSSLIASERSIIGTVNLTRITQNAIVPVRPISVDVSAATSMNTLMLAPTMSAHVNESAAANWSKRETENSLGNHTQAKNSKRGDKQVLQQQQSHQKSENQF